MRRAGEGYPGEHSINRSRPSIMTTSSLDAIDDLYAPATSGIIRWFAGRANRSSYRSVGRA